MYILVLASEPEFWVSQAILLEKTVACLVTQTVKPVPIPIHNSQQESELLSVLSDAELLQDCN